MTRSFNFLIIIFAFLHLPAIAQINDLPRSIPENEGIRSEAIIAMFDKLISLPNTDIHHVMIVRNGKVVAELHPSPYKAEYKHTLYSCSKTFVSMAVGIAINENRLRLTDRVASFFPDRLPDSISANLADITIWNLLTMTSGIIPDWEMRNHKSDWIGAFLSKPVAKPGANYYYDSMSTFTLSAIIQKVTGMKTLDYLKSRIFLPMNITEVGWEESPDGINTGGWGIHMQCESQAKFGLLLLNNGYWNGHQLIPSQWIKEASSKQVDNLREAENQIPTDSNRGYGYQIWQCKYTGAFRIDGAYGQFTVIVPDKNIVVVINSNCIGEAHNQLNAIWNILLPGTTDTKSKPGKEYTILKNKYLNISLKRPYGESNSPVMKFITGKTIKLEKNKHNISSLTIDIKDQSYILNIAENNGTEYCILFNYNSWNIIKTSTPPPYSINALSRFKGITSEFQVAGAYAWTDKNSLLMKAHYTDWISSRSFELKFNENEVEVIISENFSLNSFEKIKGTI